MRKKIILLPLDERPCNYVFPQELLRDNPEYSLAVPGRELMGNKKTPGDPEKLARFLSEQAKDADIAVVSIDTLVYGGLLSGRLHHETAEELGERLDVLGEIKRANPRIKIYAFSLIMRCPRYSSSDEEPDYYASVGKEIFLLGEVEHRKSLGLDYDGQVYADCKRKCAPYIDDYLTRRAVNVEINLRVVDLVGGAIDYLIIPQDDSSVYGFMAMDQQKVRAYVAENNKQNLVSIYPGADEVALTLLARAVQNDKGVRLGVNTFFASEHGKFVVPLYEDRMLAESVKCQIRAAGCVESLDRGDFILAVNAPASDMREANEQFGKVCAAYSVNRSLCEFVDRIEYETGRGSAVAVADVAYGNGGDVTLAAMLDRAGVAGKIAAYAGWNTSGNTLGTCISAAVFSVLFGRGTVDEFIALRFFEDVGFCSHARWAVAAKLSAMGLDYYDLKDKNTAISAEVARETAEFTKKIMPGFADGYEIIDCAMPWNRMFETRLVVRKKAR